MRACVLCVSLAIAMPALADVVFLPSTSDNTLFESPTGALSNGAGPNVFVGRNTQGSIRRGLMQFDLSAIPIGSTITGVSLTLFASQTQGPSTNIGLHRTLANWGEGASASGGGGGAPAQPGDATWIHTFSNTSFWAASGGDFAPGASAVQAVGGDGSYTWASTPGLIADVQQWLDAPATNFGWTFVGLETSNGTAKRFDSKENATVANRPVLSVEYVIPGPGGAGLLGIAGIMGLRRRRTSAH